MARELRENKLKENKIDGTKVTIIFLLTTLIFILGILAGNYITNQKISQVTQMEDNLKIDTMASELQYSIIIEDPCKFYNSSIFLSELYDLGRKVDFMESKLGQDDEDVLRLKSYYFLIEIRHWLLIKTMEKQCGVHEDVILFFYDTDKRCPDCKDQGVILSNIRLNREKLKVYSFYVGSTDVATGTLKNKYGISNTPTVIINDQTYSGLISKEKILGILDQNGTSLS